MPGYFFGKKENPVLIQIDGVCIQSRVSVNICTSLSLGRCVEPWRTRLSRGATESETASARSGPIISSWMGFLWIREKEVWLCTPVTRHQCLGPDLMPRKGDSFFTHFIESIQRVMANLLDCHGNRWEKWFLSVSVCVSRCWRCCVVRTPLQVQHRSKYCITMFTELTPLKIHSWDT